MEAQKFVDQLQHDDLTRAIREAEARTSGEIRVFVTRNQVQTPVAAAEDCFLQLGMGKTRERNAVLFFVAPLTQKFAVVGDSAVHSLCGDIFWQEIAAELTRHFQASDFTGGLIAGIRRAGDLLAKHFPRKGDDQNELSDSVLKD